MEVTIDNVQDTLQGFTSISMGVRPDILLMHPKDARSLIELLDEVSFIPTAENNIALYRGIKIISSFDIEVGKWKMY